MYIPGFINICPGFQKLMGGDMRTLIHAHISSKNKFIFCCFMLRQIRNQNQYMNSSVLLDIVQSISIPRN